MDFRNKFSPPVESRAEVPPSRIVVIQPGSKFLRIGLASDLEPHSILHAVARKRKIQKDKHSSTSPNPLMETLKGTHRDSLISLLPGKSLEEKLPPEVESARLQLCHTLQTALKPGGGQRYITPTEQISLINKLSQPELIPPSELGARSDKDSKDLSDETVFGDDVILASMSEDFNIHFPWKRGELNLHAGIGGSLTAVLNDLGDIWEWAISEKVRIALKDRHKYRAVLVIPVMFNRAQAAELISVALKQLEFSHTFVIHDHVCSTFSAALSYATVVDVGDQRISISCVEDGTSLPHTRVELKYGGGDLTLALWNLMNQSSAPFKIDLNSLWDLNFFNKLKEDFCHFDLSRCGPEEQVIIWDKPGEPVVKIKILFGDELLIVPLSYFNPDLLRGSVEPTNSVSVYEPQVPFDDPFDAKYISEMGQILLNEFGEDDEDSDIKDVKLIGTNDKKLDVDRLLGIDQAIMQSIEYCSEEEQKRRFYSSILVVGGGFKFKGLRSWLQNKITLNAPRAYRTDEHEIKVPKDKDSSTAAWRGASVVTRLDSAAELWISQSEWSTHGSRILREKTLCAF